MLATLDYLRVLIFGTFQTSVRCLNCEKQQGSRARLASQPVLTAGCFSVISSAVWGGAGGMALSLPFYQERFVRCDTKFKPWFASFGAGGPDLHGGGGAHLHLGLDPSHGKGWRPGLFPPSPSPWFSGATGLLCQVCMGSAHPWGHGIPYCAQLEREESGSQSWLTHTEPLGKERHRLLRWTRCLPLRRTRGYSKFRLFISELWSFFFSPLFLFFFLIFSSSKPALS